MFYDEFLYFGIFSEEGTSITFNFSFGGKKKSKSPLKLQIMKSKNNEAPIFAMSKNLLKQKISNYYNY